MSDHQLSHIGIQSKLRSLCSSGMISFLGACLLGLCKGGLMEKQIYIFNLFSKGRTIDCIGTISIFTRRSRRAG